MSLDVFVWDGKDFDTVTPTKAAALIAKGSHQMATGVCTNKLMTADQLKAARPKKKKQTYKTREMKADGADEQSTVLPGLPGA